MTRRVVLGRIGAPHGVCGEVRVKSFTEDPLDLGAYGPLQTEAGRTLTVETIRPAKSVVVVRFKEVKDRTDAETLTNQEISVDRSRLPEPDEDEFYLDDLVGLRAATVDGAVAGDIIAVQDFGAGDLLDIRLDNGETVFVPFTRAAVPQVDIAGRLVTIAPPAGLVGEGEENGEPET
ncbi:MAG: ribosome maturation factor RimM [Pseudomonadota bacterium]